MRICDLAGRPRGAGFVADADGTLLTSHEAVDGLARLVLHAPGGQVCLAEAGAVTALPELGLALVATEGLDVPPLPVASQGPAHPERRFRLRLPHPAAGTLLGVGPATYTATDRYHLLPEVYELALAGGDSVRVPPQASGAPLIDAATGAVLAVLATALHCGHRAAGFAIPLRAEEASGPLAALLARNAATVPAYGLHLNLAGALQLTGATVAGATGPTPWREPVERPELTDAVRDFLAADGPCPPLVLGLVGPPGSGRSTELAQLAARRTRGPHPEPTLWLRGADLRPGDGGIRDAVERALRGAARIVGAAAPKAAGPAGLPGPGDPAATADLGDPARTVADLARAAGHPLLVLLDAPEEMPPVLAHALPDWTAATAAWLRATGTRLIVACGPEFWEQAGALLPSELPYGDGPLGDGEHRDGVRDLPPHVPLADLDAGAAARARSSYGLRESDLAPADAAHPLALRLLSEVRAALPEPAPADEDAPPDQPPARAEIFSAYLDLVCLRIAVRLAAASEPPVRGTAVRRLATRAAGRVHEAARRCLGPGQGEIDREAFEEVFPWRTGWASAVLAEGLLVPAGAGYRFAHEEWGDWLQALHLDVPAALEALVHRWSAPPPGRAEAPVRLPSRSGTPAPHDGHPPPVPPAPAVAAPVSPRTLPVPHHRAAPVVQALLLTPLSALTPHLLRLAAAVAAAGPADTAPGVRGGAGETGAVGPAVTPGHDSGAGSASGLGSASAAGRADEADGVGEPGRASDPGQWGGTVGVGAAAVPAAGEGAQGAPRGVAGLGPADGVGEPGRASDPGQWGGTVGVGAAAVPAAGEGAQGAPRGVAGLGPADVPGAFPGGRAVVRIGVGAAMLDSEADTVPNPRARRAARPEQAPFARTPDAQPTSAAGPEPGDLRRQEAAWWAGHLLRETLLGVADAAPHSGVLRVLAERIVDRSVECGGFTALPPGGLAAFGPRFWRALALPVTDRLDLLRLLLPADAAPALNPRPGPYPTARRFLTAAADVVAASPRDGLPAVCGWLDDERPLQGAPRLTVASAAQAVLHTHRRLAVDELTEALVAAASPGADEVLAALAEDEPSAVCRAVDRWAHDERAERHEAAAAYGPRAAARARSAADRELLRYAALALLARPGDSPLHGAALGLLVRDPGTRSRHLPAALRRFAEGDPALPAAALAAALPTHPEPVLAAFQSRLRDRRADAGEVLDELARATAPALARRAAVLVADLLRHRPDQAVAVAHYLDVRLEQGPASRAVLLPLADALLREHPAAVRAVLAPVFAAPGSHMSRPLRHELLDALLVTERDPEVLDALLGAAADGARQRHPLLTRDLVHRVGLLFGRTAQGAARFDRRMVRLAAAAPEFADLVREWLADGGSWDALIGPSARRRLEACDAAYDDPPGAPHPPAPRAPDALHSRT